MIQLDPFTKIMVLKNYPGSFGVTGVKSQWAQINFSTLNQRWFNLEPQLSWTILTLIFGCEIVDFVTMINQKSTSQPQFNQKLPIKGTSHDSTYQISIFSTLADIFAI